MGLVLSQLINKNYMKGLSGILLTLIIAPIFVWVLNFLIFPTNNGEKYVDEYISHSTVIDIEDSNIDFDFKIKTVYTGIQTAFLRGKLSGKDAKMLTFYDINHKKYFMLCVMYQGISLQFDILCNYISDTTIKAKVNRYDLNNPDYGTKENPIPFFIFDVPKYANNSGYQKVRITEEQYRNMVDFYLTHMMSKKEFKERFKKNKESLIE